MLPSSARPPSPRPSFFRHGGFPEWGIGIAVFRDDVREEITLVFEHGGLRTVSLAKRLLVSVPASQIEEAVRGRLQGLAKGRGGQGAPPASQPGTVRRRPARDDGSSDVMDRKRRIPGSYEAGKRR